MIVKPPEIRYTIQPSAFLAGSIEMGVAEDWQKKAGDALDRSDVIIYNPRRDHWDASWVQDISNPVFKAQVDWELDMLDESGVQLFYFVPDTKSPITLMELGIAGASKRSAMIDQDTFVCCPKGFWRKGNVDIVCERFSIQTVPTVDDLIIEGRKALEKRFRKFA